jgi:hypothetical protein
MCYFLNVQFQGQRVKMVRCRILGRPCLAFLLFPFSHPKIFSSLRVHFEAWFRCVKEWNLLIPRSLIVFLEPFFDKFRRLTVKIHIRKQVRTQISQEIGSHWHHYVHVSGLLLQLLDQWWDFHGTANTVAISGSTFVGGGATMLLRNVIPKDFNVNKICSSVCDFG